jgi:dipeptidyl aminopeptidase/acylaminoacyl peptidase
VISVRSRDGLYDIEAVLVLPKGFRQGTRVPLLLAYHGGPYGDFDNRFWQYYPVHILAARGWAVLMPNVRGSSGYSDVFGQANRYDLGGGDYRDAMDVVDHLIAQGIADSARLAVIGGSYGGYLTNWTISQTQRFKSAVSMYGIFSWFTDWSNSWQPDFELMFLGHHYWEKPLDMDNPWISRSPQTFVRNITTPTLILQGDRDEYTNISNSREMYQALKALGREAGFIVYHGAGHGLRTFPNQWIDSMERAVQWIIAHTP